MKRWDRALLVLLVLAYAAGTPGLGIDTRTDAPGYLGAVYGVAFLAPIVALAASWKWSGAAAWLGVVSGLLAVALPALDIAGVLVGPPPAAMVVLDVVILALGCAVIWRSWPLTRPRVA